MSGEAHLPAAGRRGDAPFDKLRMEGAEGECGGKKSNRSRALKLRSNQQPYYRGEIERFISVLER